MTTFCEQYPALAKGLGQMDLEGLKVSLVEAEAGRLCYNGWIFNAEGLP